MNRLGKKCFIVSASLHALLLLILLFGAALMPNPDEKNEFKPLHMYSADKISDLLESSGGSPDVKVAPAPPAPEIKKPTESAPTPPAPKPEPPAPKPVLRRIEKPAPLPEPPKLKPVEEPQTHWYSVLWSPTKPKETAPKEEADDTPKKTHKVVLDKNELKTTGRTANENQRTTDSATSKADRRRAEKRLQLALRNLSSNLSKNTVTDETPGVGGGGEAWANYRDIIASKYYNAWIVPTDLDESTPVVPVTITIARSGEVISARIVTPSGIRALDRSIQSALDNVTFIEPFPASSKEKERTVTINFNPQVKRQIG